MKLADGHKMHQHLYSQDVFRSDKSQNERDSSVNWSALETCHMGIYTQSWMLCQLINAKNLNVVQNKQKLNVETLCVQVTSKNIFRPCSLFCGRRTPSDWSVTHTHIHTQHSKCQVQGAIVIREIIVQTEGLLSGVL